MSFETWVDKVIREAEAAGKFADLPGAGRPIPGAGKPDDELWWVKAKLEREKLTLVPPSLALRKEVEAIHELAETKQSEAEVRALVGELNARIVSAIRSGISGPRIALMPVKPDKVLAAWRERRAATPATSRREEPARSPASAPAPAPASASHPQRLRRRRRQLFGPRRPS